MRESDAEDLILYTGSYFEFLNPGILDPLNPSS
jgi:hypothetical protein